MKKIVVASDSFKGSASSKEIGAAVAKGVRSVFPDAMVRIFAIADGGEGTVEALATCLGGQSIQLTVEGPLGQPVEANYALIDEGKTAIMEMAQASGLTLVPEKERNVLAASTYGTGQLIMDAINRGAKRIYMGIGGSATNDGGMGMARALGVRFLDQDGYLLAGSGQDLEKIKEMDLSNFDLRIKDIELFVLSDVSNPLCGDEGASAVYGPQKGASPEDVRRLDQGLLHYGQFLERELGFSVMNIPGAGAAGGLGAGLMAFFKAQMVSGIETVLELVGLEAAIMGADLVITGEGRMDGQSLKGKAPLGVAKVAQRHQVPVLAIVGSKANDLQAVHEEGIAAVFSCVPRPMSLAEAMSQTLFLVEETAKNVMSVIKIGSKR